MQFASAPVAKGDGMLGNYVISMGRQPPYKIETSSIDGALIFDIMRR